MKKSLKSYAHLEKVLNLLAEQERHGRRAGLLLALVLLPVLSLLPWLVLVGVEKYYPEIVTLLSQTTWKTTLQLCSHLQEITQELGGPQPCHPGKKNIPHW